MNSPDIMSGEDKLAFVKEQLVPLLENNQLNPKLDCPYCGSVWDQEVACCPTMARAAQAIVEAYDLMQKIDMANRIIDKAYAN